MNVFHSENLIAAKILGGILELFCSLGEVQQEPETAHGAVEQMQQVLDQVRPGNCDDPAHDPSENEYPPVCAITMKAHAPLSLSLDVTLSEAKEWECLGAGDDPRAGAAQASPAGGG